MSMKRNVSSSQRGKDKLIDNNGYTFTYRKTYAPGNILWRCSVRNKATTCFASVTQAVDTFTKGGQPHCHQPTPGAATNAKVSREVKDVAMSNFFTSAASIVDRVILSQEDNDPCILKPSNLARQVNRKRRNKDQTTRLRSTSTLKMITYHLTFSWQTFPKTIAGTSSSPLTDNSNC